VDLSGDGLVSITIIFLWFDFSLKKVIKIDWQLVDYFYTFIFY
jgi:hypothetical protein